VKRVAVRTTLAGEKRELVGSGKGA
jgi:hypothetical protein